MFETTRHVDEPLFAFERIEKQASSSQIRWLAIVELLILTYLLGYVSGARAFPITIAGLAIFSGASPWRLRLHKPLQLWLYAVITIGFVLYYFLSPVQILIEDPLFFPLQTHLIARILISICLVTLFLRHDRDRPPIWLAGMGAVCLPFAVNLPLGYSDHHTLLYGIIAYVGVMALYGNEWRRRRVALSRRHRWPRAIALFVTLSTSLLIGAGSAYALQRYEKNIEYYLEEFLGYDSRAVRPGFTIGNRLNDVSNWKTAKADELALRVFSESPPGYLRGVVFDTYQSPRRNESLTVWTGQEGSSVLHRMEPPRGLPISKLHGQLYSVVDDSQGPWSTMEVWPLNPQGLFLFAPLETAYVAVNTGHVVREYHGTLRASELQSHAGYTLFTTQSTKQQELSDTRRHLSTRVEPDTSPRIKQLADELFADCETTEEKIHRVQQWFRTNFEYQLGIDVPRRADPLTYFLTEGRKAHCEFFATGTALLLRLADVPTRYVAGYVAVERNDLGGFWIARNKDAHAWVEAYDDAQQRWVIVESTPEAGIPQPRTASQLSQSIDTISLLWIRLRNLIRNDGFRNMFQYLWKIAWSIPGMVALTLALAIPFLLRNRRLKPWTRHREDAHLKSMHAMLSKLDQRSKAHHRERQAEETLLQFALSLRSNEHDLAWANSLADCYDLYRTLRFRSQTGPEAVEQLEKALSHVPMSEHSGVKPHSLNAPMTSQ